MRKFVTSALLSTLLVSITTTTHTLAQEKPLVQPAPAPLVSTYSIVAYDSATGRFGAAVQSHWFKVADVIWAEPGVGAVATQSLADFRYGPLGLQMMRMGKSASEALDGIIASDPQSRVRQVAMVNKNSVAAHTGSHCIDEAGDQTGTTPDGIIYSVQANLMRNATVWPAMAEAFENAEGDLAERMMIALEAAEAEGGDIRGRQSAALLVVRAETTGQSWRDNVFEVRVDDSPEPLKELRRLLAISRAYEEMNRGDELIAENKLDEAGAAYARAAELSPGNVEILFWHAVTLAGADQLDRALPIFKEVFAADTSWRELIPRLAKAELLPDDEKMIKRILRE
ncbi:MAG: DUF1028 domain-containing protein [candidate division Zixibacteria bacterium]|nr:DUF1028 domain-containing protein [candidate division Zixibacteria bacterium]